MSNILVIGTSFHGGSNSNIIAEKITEGASEKGNNASLRLLKNYHLSPCFGCGYCEKVNIGHCVQKDDLSPLLEEIAEADVLVICSPRYYSGLSGQAKILLDRMNAIKKAAHFSKFIVVMTSAGGKEENSLIEKQMEIFKNDFPFIEETNVIGFDHLFAPNQCKNDEKILNQAKVLGESL